MSERPHAPRVAKSVSSKPWTSASRSATVSAPTQAKLSARHRGVADQLECAHDVHHYGGIGVVERGHERTGGERRLLAPERARCVCAHERVRIAQERRHRGHDARGQRQLLERVGDAPPERGVAPIQVGKERANGGGVGEAPQRLAGAESAVRPRGLEQRR